MKAQRPISADDDDHRVIPFRPLVAPHPAPGRRPMPPDNDLARYERSDEPDDFRHRMWANLAAFAFTALLTAIGVWLATSLADLRNAQDCVLLGRRDCAHLVTPHG